MQNSGFSVSGTETGVMEISQSQQNEEDNVFARLVSPHSQKQASSLMLRDYIKASLFDPLSRVPPEIVAIFDAIAAQIPPIESEETLFNLLEDLLFQIIWSLIEGKSAIKETMLFARNRKIVDRSQTDNIRLLKLDEIPSNRDCQIFGYLLGAYRNHKTVNNLRETDKNLTKRDQRVFGLLKDAIFSELALFLQGYLSGPSEEEHSVPSLFMVRALFLEDCLPHNFLTSFCEFLSTKRSQQDIDNIFNPVFDYVRSIGDLAKLSDNNDTAIFAPIRLARRLSSIKIDNSRPLCKTLTSRQDWIPQPVVEEMYGRELCRLSYAGPSLSFSIFPEEGGQELLDAHFPDSLLDSAEQGDEAQSSANRDDIQQQQGFAKQALRHKINSLRTELHQFFVQVLTNAETRPKVLKFFSLFIEHNWRKAQMHPDERFLAPDGTMINFVNLMFDLSSKIKLDKVDPYYPFLSPPKKTEPPKISSAATGDEVPEPQPDNGCLMVCNLLIDLKTETRLKWSEKEQEAVRVKLVQALPVASREARPNFNTECFFLTMHTQHVSLHSMFRKLRQIMDEVRRVAGDVRRLRAEIGRTQDPIRKRTLQQRLSRWSVVKKALIQRQLCYDTILLDPELMGKAMAYNSKQLQMLIGCACPQFRVTRDLPEGCEFPDTFGLYPEFYLEDVIDFIQFMLRNSMEFFLSDPESTELMQNLVPFVINAPFFKNPFLTAKIVESIFYVCPSVQPVGRAIFSKLVRMPVSGDGRLIAALIRFYSDIETTGSHTEFFDKFTIREHLQAIFRALWDDAIQRHLFIEVATKCGNYFVKFVNMLRNDTTFLLDESLDALTRIRKTESLMENPVEWQQKTPEEQKALQDKLAQDKHHVRYWLSLGDHTLDLFGRLTKEAPKPFLNQVIGEQLASLLNCNMEKLCGPKWTELKVKNPKQYGWHPKKFLQQVIDIYLNLAASEEQRLAMLLASDTCYYDPAKFEPVLTMCQKNLTVSDFERFKNLMESTKRQYQINERRDQELGEGAPEEFLDPIRFTLMSDPVYYEVTKDDSGQLHRYSMERTSAQRIILNDAQCPFTRRPLSEEMLKEDTDLKRRILEWIQNRMKS